MRILPTICVTLLGAAPAFAQVHVEIMAPPPPRVVVGPPPVVRFAAPPPLVVVEPGVQVVRDCDDEIFVSGGWYWHAGPDGTWYRARSYRGGWVAAPPRAVPVAVARLPRGQYRHFRGEAWREQRKEERHDERAFRREQKREDKAERHWEKHHGRRG